MARIRTIKPSFWTDSVMVQLPYEARLLFIGLWNEADDEGAISDEPSELKLRLFPNDAVDVSGLLDLLLATGRLTLGWTKDGKRFFWIPRFPDHQRISHPSPSILIPVRGTEPFHKTTISSEVRRAVAQKYGCLPGKTAEAICYYCGSPGSITWYRRFGTNKPSVWVYFSDLELDHFVPELDGGATQEENIVLACRHCNRSKGRGWNGVEFANLIRRLGLQYAESSDIERQSEWKRKVELSTLLRNPEGSGKSPSPPAGKEGKGEEGNGREGSISPTASGGVLAFLPLDPITGVFQAWVSSTGRSDRTILDGKRRGFIERALKTYPREDVLDAIHGWSYSPHHRGENDRGVKYNDLELILRDSKHIEMFRDLARGNQRPAIPIRKASVSHALREQAAALRAEELAR